MEIEEKTHARKEKMWRWVERERHAWKARQRCRGRASREREEREGVGGSCQVIGITRRGNRGAGVCFILGLQAMDII